MEDLTGKQLGPYQVVAPLGEGGMAAVYKAYQPGMDRYVALKILPRKLAEDPQFVGRFKQEAKVLAKLQHPHILPVFDFGEADGYTYIVMPFVESGTLADLLRGQPLPLKQIRSVISQVGGALHYAHTHGLVHRDVKPSNVLVDESGNCLLTDFGIAKMVEGTAKFTGTGGVIGTPAYMSPEQGRGDKLDGRSDIYSLGIMFFEMATGRVPFNAETPVAIIFKHISDPLPLPRTINPALPESVERVILKALAKNPEERFQKAEEMVEASENVGETKSYSSTEPTPLHTMPALPQIVQKGVKQKVGDTGITPRRNRVFPVAAGIVVIAVIGIVGTSLWAMNSLPTSLGQATETTPTAIPNAIATASAALLSPTTPRVAFVSERDGNKEIYVMGIDGSRQTNLTNNPADDEEPSWSPDGVRIAFVSDRDGHKEIYTMNADGSDPMRLTSELGDYWSPVWSPNGSQIGLVSDRSGADTLYAISADGSEIKPMSRGGVRGFSWSPDGARVAYISSSSLQLYVVNPDNSGLVELTQSIKGSGKPVWSPKGDKIAVASYHEINSGAIYILNIEGGELRRIGTETSLDSFSWSPDGAQFATRGSFGRGGLFILDIDSGNLTQLYEGFVYHPFWMPDAQAIGFDSNGEVYSLQIGNGHIATNLTNNPGGHNSEPDWWWPRK